MDEGKDNYVKFMVLKVGQARVRSVILFWRVKCCLFDFSIPFFANRLFWFLLKAKKSRHAL